MRQEKGGELKTKLFRVGNFGGINEAHIVKFLSAMEKILKRLDSAKK